MSDVPALAAPDDGAVLALMERLVAAGRDGEAAVQGVFAAEAGRIGAAVEAIPYDPAGVTMVGEFASAGAQDGGTRTALVARAGGPGGRSLILFAHPDSEPAGTGGAWSGDPFRLRERDGRLIGWGIADDLAGVAMMLGGLAHLRACGYAPAGAVTLASTPSKRHARGVCALLNRDVLAEAAVYCHPAESGAGMGEIKAATAGELDFSIAVQGLAPPTTEPLQTGFAHLGANAIEAAMRLGQALVAYGQDRADRVRHPLMEQAVGRATNLMLSHVSAGRPTALPRMPVVCTLAGALSFPPGERLGDVQAELAAVVADAAARDPWLAAHPPELAFVAGTTGAEIPADHPLFLAGADAVRAVTGAAPLVNPMHTGSDIRHPMVQRGIPTIGLGPLCGDLSQNGGGDEWVDRDDLVRAVAVVAGLIARWCGVVPLAGARR